MKRLSVCLSKPSTLAVVLGASGMLGHKVTENLVARGYSTLAICGSEAGRSALLAHLDEGCMYPVDVVAIPYSKDVYAAYLRTLHENLGWRQLVVINCAGGIKGRVTDSEKLQDLNLHLPEECADYCNRFQFPFVHVSTDCVWSGNKTSPYTRDDVPDPEDDYGRSKLAGEEAVLRNGGMVLRTSIIGTSLPHAPYGLVEWVRTQLHAESINGYVDHLWSGVTTKMLAHYMLEGLEYQAGKLLLVQGDHCTKNEMVEAIVDELHGDAGKVVPTKGGHMNRAFIGDVVLNKYGVQAQEPHVIERQVAEGL